MEKKGKKCCTSESAASYRIEAIISIDERGQMVIPKEARAKAGIQADDKLALVGWRKGDQVCCFSLIKVEEMGEMLGELVGSLMAAAPESRK